MNYLAFEDFDGRLFLVPPEAFIRIEDSGFDHGGSVLVYRKNRDTGDEGRIYLRWSPEDAREYLDQSLEAAKELARREDVVEKIAVALKAADSCEAIRGTSIRHDLARLSKEALSDSHWATTCHVAEMGKAREKLRAKSKN